MYYVLSILGVHLIVATLSSYVTAPRIFWALLPVGLGIGAVCLFNPHEWWLGVGVAGGASLVKVTDALLLMLTDSVMMEIQRGGRSRR
jgi:hypothetical protein